MQHQKEMRLGQSAAVKENIACRMASIFENVSRHLALKYHHNYAAILEDSMPRVIANTSCANLDIENFDNDSLSSNECNYAASISESFFDARDRSVPSCNVKLKLTVRNQNDGISELSFRGQRQHSPNTIFARNIKGTLREEYSDNYRKNPLNFTGKRCHQFR